MNVIIVFVLYNQAIIHDLGFVFVDHSSYKPNVSYFDTQVQKSEKNHWMENYIQS